MTSSSAPSTPSPSRSLTAKLSSNERQEKDSDMGGRRGCGGGSSQKYHNERALYQARHLGVDAIAYNAHTPGGTSWLRNRARECLARVKLIIDVARDLNPDVRSETESKY